MIAKKSILGMWIFLATEVLFFGALFIALAVGYFQHPQAFSLGVRHMNLTLGTINTAILLTSSLMIAVGVREANRCKAHLSVLLFVVTVFLGLVFLGIKLVEYSDHFKEHLVPAFDWNPDPLPDPALQLFFIFYFIMTFLHALHMLIGVSLVSLYTFRYSRSRNRAQFLPSLENLALYWHFVDVVWVFLFPCLYLIGRS